MEEMLYSVSVFINTFNTADRDKKKTNRQIDKRRDREREIQGQRQTDRK